jgi:hypothetical protein
MTPVVMPFPRFSDDMDFDQGWPTVSEFDAQGLGRIERLVDWLEVAAELHPDYEKLPPLLREAESWVWLDGAVGSGSPGTPYLCRGVQSDEALSPKNHIRSPHFPEGLLGSLRPAFVLKGLLVGSTGLTPVAISLSASAFSLKDALNLWLCLGRPYFECALDCSGWTVVGLVDAPIGTVVGPGYRIATEGYIELGGLGGRGSLRDVSREIAVLISGGGVAKLPIKVASHRQIVRPPSWSPREQARVIEALRCVSADCTYDVYRNIVWALLGTGWPDAEQIARGWCMSAPLRYDPKNFAAVVSSFNPDLAIRPSLGTVFHHAKRGGWDG